MKNSYGEQKDAKIRLILSGADGKQVTQAISEEKGLSQDSYGAFLQKMEVANPQLWSPENPYLYTLSVEVMEND